jgi:hypothetical protein
MKKALYPLLACIFVLTGCSGNRYELVPASNNSNVDVYLVDKKTGTVWVQARGKWVNIGTPSDDAPERGNISKDLEGKQLE